MNQIVPNGRGSIQRSITTDCNNSCIVFDWIQKKKKKILDNEIIILYHMEICWNVYRKTYNPVGGAALLTALNSLVCKCASYSIWCYCLIE